MKTKLGLALCAVLIFSLPSSAALIEPDITAHTEGTFKNTELVRLPQNAFEESGFSRYLVFGPGNFPQSQIATPTDNGFFSIILYDKIQAPLITQNHIIQDLPLEFYQYSQMDQIIQSTGARYAHIKYNYTGAGTTIGIVDTGVDFSNPDVRHSLARDENGIPIMLDADGQGIVITNATFIAKINKFGQLENATKDFIEQKNRQLGKNATSTVYITKNGAFLNLKQGGKGTPIPIYNSFFPKIGPAPVFNGTVSDDYKIGKSFKDFIKSASGVYHFGMIYQGSISGPFASVQVVPVLVVDSTTAGIYDTVIADLSSSWEDYTRFDLKKGQKPKYDFDFTDETPIKLGGGNEFLVYDSNKDKKPDYSAGTVGARVLDIWGVMSKKKSNIDKIIKATNGTLLAPLDPNGNYFGIMSDFVGHGTAAAATITSKGKQQYDIYNNTKKYTLPGIAPDAKIIPIKALWFGDTIYGWLWAAGFDNTNSTWSFSGRPRADIISNSWGISNFPSLKSAPGVDVLSLVASVLSTPRSVDPAYPGVIIISSSGNAGPGYGTASLPGAAPFGITVGATTNNVYVGYGSFRGQPRFGNTTEFANDMADFSSRGPSVIGDPKPDLVATGAYGFVPSNVLKSKKDSKQESFVLFGGTSMAAPIVAGSAAITIQALKQKHQDYDPYLVKNILVSTATDLGNDVFTQGAGLVNASKAASFVAANEGTYIVYNDKSYQNIKQILDAPLAKLNTTAGLKISLPDEDLPQTSWFAGRLLPHQKSSTYFTIQNPSGYPITVDITPQKLALVKQDSYNHTTKLNLKDPLYNKTGVFRPDYIRLSDVKKHDSLASFYRPNPIPDSELLVLNLNFAFSDFMNKTEPMYAADTKIASLYLYDWDDKNKDDRVSSDELSMVNRGGSWGTVQELRVSEPASKFEKTPLVGVYAVPTRYSYWIGDTKKNSTQMPYTLSASYYAKQPWTDVWLDSNQIQIKPHSSAQILATISASDRPPGIYEGFIRFSSQNHTVNLPVSYAVVSPVSQNQDVFIPKNQNPDVIFGNGYFKGAFDFANRYNAGDWRQYYFENTDGMVNAASIEVSWNDTDSNLSAFVVDPQGRMIQTNVPPGVFGHFLDWPSSDWLGTSVFSQGGGFFPVKNKDATSTVLYVPVNQTGTYTLVLHSTLFGGKKPHEPFEVIARFSSITGDRTPPQISWTVPQYVSNFQTVPEITDQAEFSVKYYIDGIQVIFENHTLSRLQDGVHQLKIEAKDRYSNVATSLFSFVIDRTPPQITVNSPQNNTQILDDFAISFEADDKNLHQAGIILPNHTVINQTGVKLAASGFEKGVHKFVVFASDLAGNKAQKTILLQKSQIQQERQIQTTHTVIILAAAAVIGASAFSVFYFRYYSRKAI